MWALLDITPQGEHETMTVEPWRCIRNGKVSMQAETKGEGGDVRKRAARWRSPSGAVVSPSGQCSGRAAEANSTESPTLEGFDDVEGHSS